MGRFFKLRKAANKLFAGQYLGHCMTPVEAFIAELDTIPWFTNLGKPSPRDHEVFRIYHWGTWPGPEDPGFSLMSAFGMHWRDELFESAKSLPSLREAWHTIYEYVFYLTKPLVPYTEEWDLDHGPNIAVYSACYTAALVGCVIARDGSLDEVDSHECRRHDHNATVQWTLSNEWSWYQAGHWPCLYYWPWPADIDGARRSGVFKKLVIY